MILAHEKSNVISKNNTFTYSNYVKSSLTFIKKNGFNFQIEDINYQYDEKDYYSVARVEHNTSSKEFCFRVRKLIDFSKKEFYTIKKTAPFFETIYKDNPKVKKDIINIIPDFQTKNELEQYLKEQQQKYRFEKREAIRKKESNITNIEYAKRKDKQIGYFTKIIYDYDRLIEWSEND